MRMQRGAAHIAVRGRIDITPIVIRCAPPVLTKGTKWWHAPKRRAHFIIEVREDIAIAPFVDGAASASIAARRVTRHLLDYFSRELLRANA
jgi:1-acyl-sn-glycerol-3-phosphate acyltransferase